MKILKSILVGMAISESLTATAAVIQGPVVNPANGHTYYLLERNTWTASEAEAVALGGHLATVNDAQENAWICSTFQSRYLWIGLNDAAVDGDFVWSSQQCAAYRNWYPGEPNNDYAGTEDYVGIYNFFPGNQQWNDFRDTSGGIGSHGVWGVVEIEDRPVTPCPVDMAATSLNFNESLRRFDFSYTVTGGNPPEGTTVALYYASGTSLANRISGRFYLADRLPGTHQSSVPLSELPSRPLAATHILLVADASSAIHEQDEDNNLMALELAACPSPVRKDQLLTYILGHEIAGKEEDGIAFHDTEQLQALIEESLAQDWDPRFILGVAGAETTFGRPSQISAARAEAFNFWNVQYNPNRCSGFVDDSVGRWCRFDSFRDAVRTVAQLLHTDTYKGATTVEGFAKTYVCGPNQNPDCVERECDCRIQDCLPCWIGTVKGVMTALGYPDAKNVTCFGSPNLPANVPTGSIVGKSPLTLCVTDPLGRKLGASCDGLVHNEIVGAVTEEVGGKIKSIWIPNLISGRYTLCVCGTGSGTYELEIFFRDVSGNVSGVITNGQTTAGEPFVLVADVSTNDANATVIKPIFPVVINEVLSRSDTPPPARSIELHNPTMNPADIGGWFLTDDFATPKKFRIADGTIVQPSGFIVFDESQFNMPPGASNSFALPSTGGAIWLFSADANTNLTGYVHGFDFGGAEDGVSFGRYITRLGEEQYVAQITVTLTGTNAGPRVGPIVISEIMYHPPGLGTNDNSEEEFIELQNITTGGVALFDSVIPTNTWKMTGGVDFVFPSNVMLSPGEYLLLVKFDPTTNTAALSAFRSKYAVGLTVQILGPYRDQLDNSVDTIELKKPTTPLTESVPYALVDKVGYRNSAPWPGGADGFGLSLQRQNPAAYGNDAMNWIAAPPTAASATTTNGTPPTITAHPLSQTLIASQTTFLSVTATGTAPIGYQWRFNGAILPSATNSILELTNGQPRQIGYYDVAVFNGAGSAVSSNAFLNILPPARILQQPVSRAVYIKPDARAANLPDGTNVTFEVRATTVEPPLRYQWRFNGVNIPGATSPSNTVFNVQLEDEGDYSCAVTDEVSTVLSASARLSPWLQPVIVVPPVNQTVVEGSDFSQSVEVTGNPVPFAYSWRRGSLVIASNYGNFRSNFIALNTTTAGLILTNNILSSNYTMRLIVYNEANNSPGILTTWTNTVLADFDRDGIPDVVENALALSPNNPADAALDFDGDGMSNRAEYIAGTDPTNSSSYLRIERGPGTTSVSVATVSNRTYTVQYIDALGSGIWRRLADIVARPYNRVESFTDPGWNTNRFYRVVLPRQQ